MNRVTGGGLPAQIWHEFMVTQSSVRRCGIASRQAGQSRSWRPVRLVIPKLADELVQSGGNFLGRRGVIKMRDKLIAPVHQIEK